MNCYSPNDVDYVKLPHDNWMKWEDFLASKEPPQPLQYLARGYLSQWNHTNGFAIVFKNGDWIDYHYCNEDPYYSEFIMHIHPKKPSKQYIKE